VGITSVKIPRNLEGLTSLFSVNKILLQIAELKGLPRSFFPKKPHNKTAHFGEGILQS
jgi:hypothetical protein